MKGVIRASLTGALVMALVAGGALVFDVPHNLAYAIEKGKAEARYDAAARQLEKLGPEIKAVQSMSEVFHTVTLVVEPSVVHIQSEQPAPETTMQIPPELRKFFGGDDDDSAMPFHGQPRQQQTVVATGSGVIISADGYVLTNNHVVAKATRVTVTLPGDGGESYDAKVIGTDPRTDVAVIKMEKAKGLVPAQLGDSDNVQVGDWVLAIGSPFGLDRTVTAGIISAKGRANVGIADYEDFIQTDASINPGNSGGPLVDVTGKVIGMNTAIASRSGGNQGVGFTIPINMIKALLPRLEKGEQIHRGYLGVLIQPLTKKLAESFGYDSTAGAVITKILPDSPSKDVLKEGDIITGVNGQSVKDPNELRTAVANVGPSQDVKLDLLRDGKKKTVTVKLGELPDKVSSVPGSREPAEGKSTARDLLGIEVQNLTPELAKQLGFEDPKGVLVTQVQPGSEAAREGLTVGDLIVEVQGQAVKTVDQFTAALGKLKDRNSVRLLVMAHGGAGSRFVLIPLKKK
ncbi:MAG: trypsin-like peptidase domain-containing protein [Phycisphaerae bacterium]|nr:trypsin-like peptidase domain-containing protein [Phycisphaerae bacterium]